MDLLHVRLPASSARCSTTQNDADFETAKVEGRGPGGGEPIEVHTDRGDRVRAAGRRRARLAPGARRGSGYQPPDAPLSRGLEVHPPGSSGELEIWIDRAIVPAGYGWSFPAGDEVRVGVGSFDPRFHVKDPTVDLAERLEREPSATRATGSRTACAPRPRAASSSPATRPATACR